MADSMETPRGKPPNPYVAFLRFGKEEVGVVKVGKRIFEKPAFRGRAAYFPFGRTLNCLGLIADIMGSATDRWRSRF